MFTKVAFSLRHLFALALLIFIVAPAAPAKIPLAANAGCSVAREASLRGQAVIDTVPVAERAAFIRYNLAKAMRRLNSTTYNATGRSIEPRLFLEPNALLSPTQLLEFENIPTYPQFGEDLFYWMRDRLQVAEDNLYTLLNSRSTSILWCTASGICYYEPDLGGLCCPF
nr:uncharacterized protein LOC106616495 [Bactrocera oleae]